MHGGGVNKRVLVVEDDPDMVDLLVFTLRQRGFLVGTAFDGIEALKKVKNLRPDLILLDILLPELNGLAVCETLHRDPGTASIPVIILSALPGQFARLTGLEAGAIEFVPKPFSPRHLIERIRRALRMDQEKSSIQPRGIL